jgi:hypothetical protein
MRQVSLALSSTLDLQQLLKNLFHIVDSSIRPELIAAYLWHEDSKSLRLVLHSADRQEPFNLPNSVEMTSDLGAMLSKSRNPVFREVDSDLLTATAAQQLAALHVDCACPIVHEGNLWEF